jgi:hypothetical protein
MSDTFNVTASWSQSSYGHGQTMTGTIHGNATRTVLLLFHMSEAVTIDTSRPIVDHSSQPRTWAVSANKLSITAVA